MTWLFIILLTTFSLQTFSLFGVGNKKAALKNDILKLSKKVNRGLTESKEEREKISELFNSLEKLNTIKDTVSSPLLNGSWVLQYTTSDAILGRKNSIFQGGQVKVGEVLQDIDNKNLKAVNKEVVNYFGINVNRKVTADLTPVSNTEVKVQFKRFSIGPLSFNAPESFKGRLDVTYLDEGLRLSRGDKGNIFVLTRA